MNPDDISAVLGVELRLWSALILGYVVVFGLSLQAMITRSADHKDRASWIHRICIIAHGLVMIVRGLIAGGVPLFTAHDRLLTATLAAGVAWLLLKRRLQEDATLTGVMAVAAACFLIPGLAANPWPDLDGNGALLSASLTLGAGVCFTCCALEIGWISRRVTMAWRAGSNEGMLAFFSALAPQDSSQQNPAEEHLRWLRLNNARMQRWAALLLLLAAALLLGGEVRGQLPFLAEVPSMRLRALPLACVAWTPVFAFLDPRYRYGWLPAGASAMAGFTALGVLAAP
ncbi:MAG: hypothetical protein GMKNLPBB_00931 [Myxococcota bacterium]|nr:hypothetical protein [Myxococcota bacterium]